MNSEVNPFNRIPKADREDVMAAKVAATRLSARVRGLSSETRAIAMKQIAKEVGGDLIAEMEMALSVSQ